MEITQNSTTIYHHLKIYNKNKKGAFTSFFYLYILLGWELLESVSIADGVSLIPSKVFEGCESLEDIKLQNGVITIAANAFTGCISLNDSLVPQTVKSDESRSYN